MAGPWHGVPVEKAVTARWPIVEPRTEKTADGRPICLEKFLDRCSEENAAGRLW